jgi:large subunit ribosomal protein L31
LSRHPELHLIDAVCATCGTTLTVRSTAESLAVDVCSNCHPAYTGAQRASVRGDRIERFNRRRVLANV